MAYGDKSAAAVATVAFADRFESLVREIRLADLTHALALQEMELRALKAERGNETLQERIREKDAVIADLKDLVQTLRGRDVGKPQQQQQAKTDKEPRG